MALWGNSDNLSVSGVSAGATVRLDYSTGTVTGSGTTFGRPGAGQTGDVIRFGTRYTGTYYGDAVIVSIASTTSLTIGSTEGLSGASIASTVFTVSELPEYTILDSSFSENTQVSSDGFDKYCYAVADAGTESAVDTSYKVAHGGWVGVQTYVDGEGNYRVKSETLVAMSGIITAAGNNQEYPPIQS